MKPACQACPHCSCSCSIILFSFLIWTFKSVLLGHLFTEVPYHYLLTVCLSLFSKLVFVTQHMLGKIPQPSTLPCITTHQISVHKSIYMIVYSYAKLQQYLKYTYILSLVIPPLSPKTMPPYSLALLTCTTILNVVMFLDYAFPLPSMLDECFYIFYKNQTFKTLE